MTFVPRCDHCQLVIEEKGLSVQGVGEPPPGSGDPQSTWHLHRKCAGEKFSDKANWTAF